MKTRLFAVVLTAMMISLLFTACGNEPSPSKPASAEPADAGLSHFEARKILQIWLDAHPNIEPPFVLSFEYNEYSKGGEDYYWFSLDDNERYWANFLVHKETGELLFMLMPDGEHPEIEIESLDDWYSRYYD